MITMIMKTLMMVSLIRMVPRVVKSRVSRRVRKVRRVRESEEEEGRGGWEQRWRTRLSRQNGTSKTFVTETGKVFTATTETQNKLLNF